MVDCADANVALDYLIRARAATNQTLGSIIITHSDRDHCRGVAEVLMTLSAEDGPPIDVFYANDRHPADQTLTWLELVDVVQSLCDAQRVRTHSADERVVCQGEGWSIEIVHPRHDERVAGHAWGKTVTNPLSAVVRVTYGQGRVVIGGDAPAPAIETRVGTDVAIRALRTPHHGANQPDLDQMYRKLVPASALISVGTRNGHHPREEHIAAARVHGKSDIVCTQITPQCCSKGELPDSIRDEFLALYTDKAGHDPLRARSRHNPQRAPRRKEVPCGGTISLTMDVEGGCAIEPALKDHARRMQARLGSQPLCVRDFATATHAPPSSAPPAKRAPISQC